MNLMHRFYTIVQRLHQLSNILFLFYTTYGSTEIYHAAELA